MEKIGLFTMDPDTIIQIHLSVFHLWPLVVHFEFDKYALFRSELSIFQIQSAPLEVKVEITLNCVWIRIMVSE